MSLGVEKKPGGYTRQTNKKEYRHPDRNTGEPYQIEFKHTISF